MFEIQIRDLSLNLNSGDVVNLCFAHRAGAISLKKGGRRGLVVFKKNKLKPSTAFLNFDVFIQ